MSDVDVAWLAGLMEGDGCFFLNKHYGPRVQLTMTDFDVVRKARDKTGACGSVREYQPVGGRKPALKWEVSGKLAIDLMKKLLPHMGERRSLKIRELITADV
jgi:hypothetical protein